MPPLTFALVGDVHGQLHAMVHQLQRLERQLKLTFDLVAQVGDLEPHRHEEDLRTMAAPAKYKQLGDFHDFHQGRAQLPWPTYFIGGNHEPYGWLDEHLHGAELIPNLHYLGRAGSVTPREDFRISGLSGVFDAEAYEQARPPIHLLSHLSNKRFIHYTRAEVEALLAWPRPELLLLHEWPEGLTQERKHAHRIPGSEPARLLIELLQPRLVACGHMHRRHHHLWRHPDGSPTEIVCLDHISARSEALAAYQWDGEALRRLA